MTTDEATQRDAAIAPYRPMDSAELKRFMDRVMPEPNTGCWLWLGNIEPWSGYSRFRLGGRGARIYRAHRLSFIHFVGNIAEDAPLDHVRARGCNLRCCVNPDHLEPVSTAENTRRGDGPTAVNSRKSTCNNGHALGGSNLGISVRGDRVCKACRRIGQRRIRATGRVSR